MPAWEDCYKAKHPQFSQTLHSLSFWLLFTPLLQISRFTQPSATVKIKDYADMHAIPRSS